jgi:NAD(P)-dependent dehydrogenase (short-subunit alcohol dehydrogenase family)
MNYLESERPDASETIALVKKAGAKAVPLPGDIRDEAFCNKLVEDASSGLGGIDILVNVAGHQIACEDIAVLTTEQFDETFKANVYAMFWLRKAALPHMQPGATIINTASIVAYSPSKRLLDYSSTKAAIVAFTKALAKQVAEKGIRVNAVAPGPVWTPLQPSGGQLPQNIPHFGEKVPLGRPGQPAELASVYIFLASQESSYVTAEVYGVTGAHHLP